eukprot:gene7349-15000_t
MGSYLTVLISVAVLIVVDCYLNKWLIPRIGLAEKSHSKNTFLYCSDASSKKWAPFFVEFRGGEESFRIDEFRDAASCFLAKVDIDSLHFSTVIKDSLSDHPLCATVLLPNSSVAISIAERCSTLRSISELCGDGEEAKAVCRDAIRNYQTVVQPHVRENGAQTEESWRFTFRRYGRGGKSGRSYSDKREFLETFDPFLSLFAGKVNLTHPRHDFLYLEDWSGYHEQQTLSSSSVSDESSSLESFEPSRSYLTRILAEGPEVERDFSVKDRPFIGTTTMDAVSSHIAANAAQLLPGQLMLDPFCGTGSLLLSCASLGARVIGSDVDEDCLGLSPKATTAYKDRSKNARFKRKGDLSQLDCDLMSNFEYYHLEDKLVGRMAMDAVTWLKPKPTDSGDGSDSSNICLDTLPMELDAIVTDPPFGRREKAMGATSDLPLGNNRITSSALLALAGYRLRVGGRLVFWLPTDGFVSEEEVLVLLAAMRTEGGVMAERLTLYRTRAQHLHDGLWRWLCVFVRTT